MYTERYKCGNCSNKGNNIWTCTPPCEHRAAPICCAPLVKEGGQGKPRCNFHKSLFQVLREDFLTLVFPECSASSA